MERLVRWLLRKVLFSEYLEVTLSSTSLVLGNIVLRPFLVASTIELRSAHVSSLQIDFPWTRTPSEIDPVRCVGVRAVITSGTKLCTAPSAGDSEEDSAELLEEAEEEVSSDEAARTRSGMQALSALIVSLARRGEFSRYYRLHVLVRSAA